MNISLLKSFFRFLEKRINISHLGILYAVLSLGYEYFTPTGLYSFILFFYKYFTPQGLFPVIPKVNEYFTLKEFFPFY
jgi:hypothetical protein